MRIRELREDSGMNRAQFAEFFGIPYRTIQHWEEGTRQPPEYVVSLIEYKLLNEKILKKSQKVTKNCK